MIPFMNIGAIHADLKAALNSAFLRVLDSDQFIAGRELEAFEQEFADYCGVRYCIGVGNGLDALTLSLRAWGIGAGDEVIVPSHTFIATWLAVSMAGAPPVPVDIDARTYCIDPEQIAASMTPRTRAIIPVHFYGLPANMRWIREIADTSDLFVLEDAAQAHGATFRNVRVGALGHAAAFSFYPIKNLGALGDAGAIVTNDATLATTARKLRNYGSEVKNVHELMSVNSRLDELQAALLQCKLHRLPEWNTQRIEIARRYGNGLKDIDGLTLPQVPEDSEHVFHIYAVRSPRRDALKAFLRNEGIMTQIHYPTPPHLQAPYAHMGLKAGTLPNGEAVAKETLSLPIYPNMPDDAVQAVIESISTFYRKCRN